MEKVIAKFVCVDKQVADDGTGNVQLLPVTSGSPENDSFFNATPSGSLGMNILNPDALKVFERDKQYYLTFTPAEPV